MQFSNHPGHGNARQTAEGFISPKRPAPAADPGKLSQPVTNPYLTTVPKGAPTTP